MIEIFVVIRKGTNQYYLLKVVRSGFDVYCIPPHLGIHYTLHESGESHFRFEKKADELREQPPVALVMGEAGIVVDKGIIRAPLGNLGRASGICNLICSVTSLSHDFQKFQS